MARQNLSLVYNFIPPFFLIPTPFYKILCSDDFRRLLPFNYERQKNNVGFIKFLKIRSYNNSVEKSTNKKLEVSK